MSENNVVAAAAAPTSETDNSGKQETNTISDPEAAGAPPTPKMTKRLKLKIDNQEFDEELPFEIDENNKAQMDYLIRHLQMSKVSNKRMSEASNTRKQAENFIQALQTDPMKILSNPKLMGEEKFQKLAEEFLSKKIQDQMLTPEERQQIDMRKRLEEYEVQEKTQKEQAEAKQVEELQHHYAQEFEKTIVEGLKSSSLPKNAFTVKRMASLMQKSIQHGFDLTPQQLATIVKEDYQQELISLIGNSEADQILSLFGDTISNKIRKHDLAKFKNSGVKNNTVSIPEPPEPNRKMRPHEFNEYLKRKHS